MIGGHQMGANHCPPDQTDGRTDYLEGDIVVVVVDPKLLSSSLLYSQCQADESACLLQLV